MRFPDELWAEEKDRDLIHAALKLFEKEPVLVTDQLTNIVWVSPAAEEIFDEHGEAIVNRATFSLLGFDDSAQPPEGLVDALHGKTPPWRGIIHPGSAGTAVKGPPRFAEASAVKEGDRFVCGLIRFGNLEGQ